MSTRGGTLTQGTVGTWSSHADAEAFSFFASLSSLFREVAHRLQHADVRWGGVVEQRESQRKRVRRCVRGREEVVLRSSSPAGSSKATFFPLTFCTTAQLVHHPRASGFFVRQDKLSVFTWVGTQSLGLQHGVYNFTNFVCTCTLNW